ncbi:hypothetical protein [Apibacter mensalis]|uniref:hypothetical protein n=1 Tax=Apibacter mensalis TaxID=1586267 RepID=UPI0026EA3396|nr:hypothetical protein [Apibacter mensalis]
MSHRKSDKISIILNKKEDIFTQIEAIKQSEQSDFKNFNITEKKYLEDNRLQFLNYLIMIELNINLL